jgi:intein/homing endonuclease
MRKMKNSKSEGTLIKRDFDSVLILKKGKKKFEYWVSQEKLIPPWITNWYQLKDYEYLILKRNVLKKIVKRCIQKAGNIRKLTKVIKIGAPLIYRVLKGKNGISVKNLRKLLYYLQIPYDEINDKIVEIKKGKRASIKNPKFPINLLLPEAATIIGFLVSDGGINLDKKARMTKRVTYSTQNLEDINTFIKNIYKIFGKVLIQREERRNSLRLRIGTSIVAEAFLKVGCILGKKVIKNKGVPWIIKEASEEMKINYLRAVFSDEGSVGGPDPYVILSRSTIVNSLNRAELKLLNEFVEPKMSIRFFPDGRSVKEISIGELRKILNSLSNLSAKRLLQKIESNIPQLLLEESKLLCGFGIENAIYPTTLYKKSKNQYALKSSLMVGRKESLLQFYKKVGFQSFEKQEKLRKYLKNWGWLLN